MALAHSRSRPTHRGIPTVLYSFCQCSPKAPSALSYPKLEGYLQGCDDGESHQSISYNGGMPLAIASHIRIILVGTTHPGNIGSAARAMKVMGLNRMVLVGPKHFPSGEATALASSADDILANATVVETFEQAIAGCRLVVGTTAHARALPWPTLDLKGAASRVVGEASQHEVAVVFGREKTGLHNAEVERCHYIVTIPTAEEYTSLNLAQAIQLMSYELRLAALDQLDQTPPMETPPIDWVPEPAERLEIFFERLEAGLLHVGFLNPAQPKRLMQRLRRLFLRARPDENELNILNGIASALIQSAPRDSASSPLAESSSTVSHKASPKAD